MTTTNTLALHPIDDLVRACKARIDPTEWAYVHSLFPCSGLFYIPEIGYAFDQTGLQFEKDHNAFDLKLDVEGLQVLHVPVDQAWKVEKPLDFYGLCSPDSEPVQYPELDRAVAEWAADVFAAGEVLTALEAAQQAQERRLDEIAAGIEAVASQPTQTQQAALRATYHPAVRGATPSDWYDMQEETQRWLLRALQEAGEVQVRIPVLWEGWEAKVLEVAEGPAPGMVARSGTEWLRLFQQCGTGTEG